MRYTGRPAWQVDVGWFSALLLALTVLAGTMAGTMARITTPASGPTAQAAVLDLALLDASGGAPLLNPVSRSYDGRGPLELLPGTGVGVDPTEIVGFGLEEARGRLAGVLTDRRLRLGSGWLDTVLDPPLREQLAALDQDVLSPLAEAELRRIMLPLGLDDGTRAADWPTQLAQSPGQPVQPIVGVFVTMPASQVQGASPRLVGERVVAGLSQTLNEQGGDAARTLVSNPNLSVALSNAIEGPVRTALHQAMAAALRTYDGQMASRLSEARTVLIEPLSPNPLSGALLAADLSALPADQARARSLELLGESAYRDGLAAVRAALATPEARARVEGAGWLIQGLDASAHGRYLAWTWVLGIVAFLLAAVAGLTASGAGRVLVPGLAILIGAAAPLWLTWTLTSREAIGGLPAGVGALGVPGAWRAWGTQLTGGMAEAVAQTALWAPLVVAGLGALLLLIGLVATLAGWLRPRRRGRF